MSYVDGFVLPVPKDKVDEYKKMATLGRDMWMKHGALAYLEAVADDVPHGELTSFPRAVMARDDETTVFAYIVFRDRAHRDEVVRGDDGLRHPLLLAQARHQFLSGGAVQAPEPRRQLQASLAQAIPAPGQPRLDRRVPRHPADEHDLPVPLLEQVRGDLAPPVVGVQDHRIHLDARDDAVHQHHRDLAMLQ